MLLSRTAPQMYGLVIGRTQTSTVSEKMDSSWTQRCTPVIPTFGRLRTAVKSTPDWVTTARPCLKKTTRPYKTKNQSNTHIYIHIYISIQKLLQETVKAII